MLKAVFKLDLHDDEEKRAAMKIISGFAGVDSIDINMREKKLTVCGAMDPVELVGKLRKQFHTEIVSVGPAKRTHPPPLYNYGRYVNVLNDPDIFIVSTNLWSM